MIKKVTIYLKKIKFLEFECLISIITLKIRKASLSIVKLTYLISDCTAIACLIITSIRKKFIYFKNNTIFIFFFFAFTYFKSMIL